MDQESNNPLKKQGDTFANEKRQIHSNENQLPLVTVSGPSCVPLTSLLISSRKCHFMSFQVQCCLEVSLSAKNTYIDKSCGNQSQYFQQEIKMCHILMYQNDEDSDHKNHERPAKTSAEME